MNDDPADPPADAGDGRGDGDLRENVGDRFGRLPATADEREVAGRVSRREVVEWWDERFGVPPETWADHTFWERGAGKVWAFASDVPSPIEVEGLGMTVLRTRQEHWKPTTEAVQRFGGHATRNVLTLDEAAARRFVAGENQTVDWNGDWGYLVVAHDIAGGTEPIGVGLYVHGELRSQIPKGRRRNLR